MGEKIIVGPINRGLRNDRKPFNIDNDSFPVLINAYQWRGRIKRKRGTSLLCRLQRRLDVTDGAGNVVINLLPVPIITTRSTFTIGSTFFTDPGGASPVALITNGPGTASLDRTTGVLTVLGSNPNTAVFYYPTLPVMGLEDLLLGVNQFPRSMGFDTVYSYGILSNSPYTAYDVSFYKNLVTGSFTGYVQKGTWTPTWWNGQDYQQMWTVNYQGALWATNGITQPFTTSNIGMQFLLITGAAIVAGGPPATVTFNIAGSTLEIGDFVFINEIVGMTGVNYQTGYVISIVAGVSVTVEFPNATVAGVWGSGGIVQYLTNRQDTTKDGIRWFDGDPVDVNGSFSTGKGWVNFAPPLSQGTFSIADLPAAVYYLVGAKMIIPFKDRLLFLGPVVQTSSGTPKYLQDTVIYSLNGTPYYTASYTNDPSAVIDTPTSITNRYTAILVPDNQTSFPPGYFEDQAGFGGFIQAGIDEPINTCETSGDVLIVGFSFTQTKLVFTGNDIIPFLFYLINTELGSSSTFGSVNMGKSVLSRGSRGYIGTDQTQSNRFDEEIPDEVFQIRLTDNGAERFTSIRDYLNEWIYFTYPTNTLEYKFPNQTLQFNYKDGSFAQFNECFTTYGIFRKVTGNTWATIGAIFPTWASWNDPWNSGSSTLLQPQIIGGNQQGFVLLRDEGTAEGNSLAIQNIVGSTVTSPNHTLSNGDYIVISGALGTVGASVNNMIFSVSLPSANTFTLNPPLLGGLTYLGGGVIKKMYVPFIQTKQFPVSWGMGRKTRLGPQQYLLTTTSNAEITLLIYLSQNSDDPYNDGPIVPATNSVNNSLIYSTVLYTCPESVNLGLTPANTNLQMISNIDSTGTNASSPQDSIWHRVNTSLIGDTIQVGFSMSDAQMRDITFKNQFAEVELHGFILDCSPSQLLA